MELANRVSALDRLDLCERFQALAATAVQLRHPDSAWLVGVRPEDLASEHLVDTVMRLEAWVAEQRPREVHPDSYLARRGG